MNIEALYSRCPAHNTSRIPEFPPGANSDMCLSLSRVLYRPLLQHPIPRVPTHQHKQSHQVSAAPTY